MPEPVAIGLDLGTSGVRAVALSRAGTFRAMVRSARVGPVERTDPAHLWRAVADCLSALVDATGTDARPVALAIAATSGSLLGLDTTGRAVTPIALYSDRGPEAVLDRIRAHAPDTAAVHGATSPLARLIACLVTPRVTRVAFEGDFILGRLAGRALPADVNTTLKAGADPLHATWPDWFDALKVDRARLPGLVAPGTDLGPIAPDMARALGLPASLRLVSGTTDGCAAALAAGLAHAGDAVTSLGSTLILKILSDTPVTAPRHGIYSHRLLGRWLVGGASNAGGAALRTVFSDAQMTALAGRIDPDRPTGLRYVPLTAPGERFPVDDPDRAPVMGPRPADDALYLQGLLEALVRIEAEGYATIARLGGPAAARLFSTGGGTRNPAWMRLRAAGLAPPLQTTPHAEPAFGAARLAWSAQDDDDVGPTA